MFICKFFWLLIKNWKLQRILNRVYEDDKIIEKMSYALGAQFRRDWIGRLYVVLNPWLKDGKLSPEMILEYNDKGDLDDKMYMEQWVMTRLNIISSFIQANNLFDLLVYRIDELRDNNYLLVVQPYTLERVLSTGKKSFIELLLWVMIAIGLFIFVL